MIQRAIAPELEQRLASLEGDGITVFTLGGGRARGALLNGSRMVASMAANHELGGLETMLLGRAYLCAALLGSTIKEGDRLALRVDGDGPAEGLSVEASSEVSVRGRLFRSPIVLGGELESFEGGNLFGTGSLTMTRFSAGKGQSFVGRVALKTGRLAEDLAAYYLQSEQTRTAFDVGIEFDTSGRAIGAGALFIQALPGANDDFLERVETCLPSLPRLGRYFAEGGERLAFLEERLHELFPEILGDKGAAFACACSRERFGSFLRSGTEEFLSDLAEKGPWPIETVCHNCGSAYYFEKTEIEEMLASRGKASN
jgi:molecular chaperone Hsp33